MSSDPDSTQRAMHLLSTSRHLERIADLATNIAEDVVFMVAGELIRHGRDPRAETGPRG
jgi:phosphate transport system protein